jgi:hypothetical protein
VIYARAFFDLQLRFARMVSSRSGLPVERALLEYTNLYIRFGLGRDFDPAHPIWQAYVAGLRDTGDDGAWTYRFYGTRAVAPPALVATFGCFSYGRLSDERIRLHFHNAETDGRSPLAIEHRARRLSELRALVAHATREMRPPVRVVGASWLYNLEAYRRLFPKSYVATAHVLRSRFQFMPLWGQFLDRHGDIKERVARELLDRLERQSGLEFLDECFPYPVLGVEAPLDELRAFYDVPHDTERTR